MDRWYLGQPITHGRLPDGTSHSINVARAMNYGVKDFRIMVLKRAIELARDGVEILPVYQK